MNVLIVDDEMQIVEIIKRSIDWSKLNIAQVFTAYNAQEARRILEKEYIQIAVCDIEMPQENGLDLISWSKNHSPETLNIILTSYPQFEYAQDAIEQGVFQYLLKPVAYDKLENVIQNAVDKVKEDKRVKEYSEFGKNVSRAKEDLKQKFYQNLLDNLVVPKSESIKREADKFQIEWDYEDKYCCILFHNNGDMLISGLEGSLKYALLNILEELSQNYMETTGFIYRNNVVAICHYKEGSVEEFCKQYMEQCQKLFPFQMCAFASGSLYLWELPATYIALKKIISVNVFEFGIIHHLDRIEPKAKYTRRNQQQKLSQEIIAGDINGILENAGRVLREAINRYLIDREFLLEFRRNVQQLVYSYMGNISISQIMDEDWNPLFYGKYNLTIEDTWRWLEYLDKTLQKESNSSDTKDVVKMTKRFLEENYQQDITRESVSEAIYLNSDYLNRIFKKETGYTLMNYLQKVRIESAKKYLRETELSISIISQNTGFDTATYFTKIFRKLTGITPKEYRENR
ncbi:response regulator [Lachnospiraceae bacterium ZAX-1]